MYNAVIEPGLSKMLASCGMEIGLSLGDMGIHRGQLGALMKMEAMAHARREMEELQAEPLAAGGFGG